MFYRLFNFNCLKFWLLSGNSEEKDSAKKAQKSHNEASKNTFSFHKTSRKTMKHVCYIVYSCRAQGVTARVNDLSEFFFTG